VFYASTKAGDHQRGIVPKAPTLSYFPSNEKDAAALFDAKLANVQSLCEPATVN
jgi:hypothetical protein